MDVPHLAPHAVSVSNPDKLLFPDDGITKAGLVAYYQKIAGRLVPFLRDRPLMTQHFPRGIGAPGFRQQHVPEHYPDWIRRVTVPKEDGTVTHVLCNDASTLVYLASQNCITPHPWLSRCDRPNHPDRLVFDLDPPAGRFAEVCEGALGLHELLHEIGLTSFVMTSGSKGLHVVVPLDRSADFDAVRGFARDVAVVLVERQPESLTTEIRKEERRGRVFIDVLRNAYGQTSVPPYAVRARPGAPVATPLHWEEVARKGLDPQQYTIKNLFRRLGQMRHDPWEALGEHPYALDEARRRLEALAGRPAAARHPA